MFSIPTETLIKPGVTPEAICSALLNCSWVVLAGWITSVLASPTLANKLANLSESITDFAASAPPFIYMFTTPPKPLLKYLLAKV